MWGVGGLGVPLQSNSSWFATAAAPERSTSTSARRCLFHSTSRKYSSLRCLQTCGSQKHLFFSTKVMYILHTFLAGAQIFQWSIYITVVPRVADKWYWYCWRQVQSWKHFFRRWRAYQKWLVLLCGDQGRSIKHIMRNSFPMQSVRNRHLLYERLSLSSSWVTVVKNDVLCRIF